MSFGRNAYIGAGEVTNLIGAQPWNQIVGAQPWQQIVGAPWQQIVGASTYYPQYAQNPYPNDPRWAAWWARTHPHHHHHRPYQQYNQYSPWGQGQCSTARDHRRANLYRAYVQGDPSAVGALALMGAEDQAAAQTGVPPADATIPAPPLSPADQAAAQASTAVTPPAPVMAPPPVVAPVIAPVIAPPPPVMAPPDMGPPTHHHHHHRHHGGGGWGPQGPGPGPGWEVQPRNAMIDYPAPSRADRICLPLSSGTNILPNTTAQITSRPQTCAFRPERLIVGGTPGHWIVNEIKVGNQSQLAQSGDLPGEMFAATTIDSFVSFATVQTAMDFVVVVTNVGPSEAGEPFVAGVLGTAAV